MLEKIKRLCKEQGISVLQLEEKIGIAHSIHRWDTNRPSVDKVKMVADYFGVSVDYLLSDQEEYDDKEELLQMLFADRPEMRMLFKVTQNATKEDILKAVKIIETLKK